MTVVRTRIGLLRREYCIRECVCSLSRNIFRVIGYHASAFMERGVGI